MIEERPPRNLREQLDFAIENLEGATYSFAIFVDAIKTWQKMLYKQEDGKRTNTNNTTN